MSSDGEMKTVCRPCWAPLPLTSMDFPLWLVLFWTLLCCPGAPFWLPCPHLGNSTTFLSDTVMLSQIFLCFRVHLYQWDFGAETGWPVSIRSLLCLVIGWGCYSSCDLSSTPSPATHQIVTSLIYVFIMYSWLLYLNNIISSLSSTSKCEDNILLFIQEWQDLLLFWESFPNEYLIVKSLETEDFPVLWVGALR